MAAVTIGSEFEPKKIKSATVPIVSPSIRHEVKAMVFPVVMYGCKSWTIKKAEQQRTEAFKL